MNVKPYSYPDLKKICTSLTNTTIKETKKGALVFTEYGARLLGLFPDKNLPNVLWTHPKLKDTIQSNSWALGGERLWLSPEQDYNYDNPRDFEGFRVPAGMDPGNYNQTSELTFENEFSILNAHTSEMYEACKATRMFSIVADPYKTGLAFAGASIVDKISIGLPGISMCCWSLAQVFTNGPKQPGTALFPVKKGDSLVHYFSPIPADRFAVKSGYARFKIDSDSICKLAVKPEFIPFDNPVKAVYLSQYPDSKTWFCVIKRSDDLPKSQKSCVDPAKSNPTGPKGAIQSYNNGKAPGATFIPFGEIELQLAKATTTKNVTTSKATHELLAYAGKKSDILELARKALKLKVVP